MKCPVCGNTLQGMTIGDISVDVCRGGCGGIWFDNHELQKFDEPHETAGQALLDVERNEKIRLDLHKKRHCPKCHKAVMTRRLFSARRHVEIDECPQCAGMWLDYGELGTLRHQYTSQAQREKAAEEYFAEVLGPDFAKRQGPGDLDTTGRITRVFRFLSPRYRFWG